MESALTIHKVIAGGKGLGRLQDGMIVMIAGVLPGETVTVRITKSHRGHKEAELVRVLESSPLRSEPACPLYGRCGGCDLQHARPEAQRAIKEAILRESLERAGLECAGHLQPALPSPQDWGYRFRLRLHLDHQGRLGFHQVASNIVVPVRRCLLATDKINQTIAALEDERWPARLADQVAAIELLHSPADDRIILALEPRPEANAAALAAAGAAMRGLADAVVLRPRRGAPDAGNTAAELSQTFTARGRSYCLTWDHRCFFQVNAHQNARLIALALEHLPGPTAPWTALDLFCGSGNFSLPLALAGAAVTGIEANPHAIAWARRNSQAAGLDTSRFLAMDAGKSLHNLTREGARFDCVLFDPPRQGLGKATALLPRLGPDRIIAISCDPATLARDLALLTKDGYRLSSIRPVDMFPQTHHIESLACLERI